MKYPNPSLTTKAKACYEERSTLRHEGVGSDLD